MLYRFVIPDRNYHPEISWGDYRPKDGQLITVIGNQEYGSVFYGNGAIRQLSKESFK